MTLALVQTIVGAAGFAGALMLAAVLFGPDDDGRR